MGCANSTQEKKPVERGNQEKQKSNQQPLPKTKQLPERRQQQKPIPDDEQAELRQSGRPGWQQTAATKTLAAPEQAPNINNSPVDIIFSSDQHENLPELHMASLESRPIIPNPPLKMSEILQTEQEQLVSNEIQKLQSSHKDPKEQLKAINSHIRHNSQCLQDKVKEEEIRVEAPQHTRLDIDMHVRQQPNWEMDSEQVLAPFSFQLPARIQILPLLRA